MINTDKLREQILSQKPTEEQRAAIFAEESEFLLRASPGSGKTWTSCRRFIWRGSTWQYPVGGLALLSFTNAAIREFHEATIKVGRRDLLSDPNYVGTFDSFVERFIISPFGHLFNGCAKRPKLYLSPRPGDRQNSKLQAWTEQRRPVPAWEITPFIEEGNKVAFKASLQYGGAKLPPQRGVPVHELFKLGFYTHSQRVYLACRILFERPHIAECLSRRFPEIIVDEAQDTNAWLLVLLNFLREKGTSITLVGDPDQCIYEFSMADATTLPALKEKWSITEKPLSKSFRCNNSIADAVRNISGNHSFVGCGSSENDYRKPFIVREPASGFNYSIAEFQKVLGFAGVCESESAILCRAHRQLEEIRGEVHYVNLQGITKELAKAAFYRDFRKDYKKAFQIIEKVVRTVTDDHDFWEELDETPYSEDFQRVQVAIWKFTKSSTGLPSISLDSADWIASLKASLADLLKQIGIQDLPKLGQKIRRTGLDDVQMALPLFSAHPLFPPIRQETIHQVKGESIDGVLVLGAARFFNSVVEAIETDNNTEERRLAYVAMTRARHLLVVGLPATHFDRHADKWVGWGFNVL